MMAAAGVGSIVAQNSNSVTGTVVDQQGNPVEGAKVSVLGSAKLEATNSTDKDGKFSIVTGGEKAIVIQLGDGSQKIVNAEDGNDLYIIMDPSTFAINYGFPTQQTVAESTGAVSIVTSNNIENRSSFTLGNSMYGNAAGLTTMQTTGKIWDIIPSMQIRGIQTFNNAGILVVVDGLERDDAYEVLKYMTPEEVESVSVLKDAAAIALYGMKGVNGVLNIVTKRGKYNSREISFSYDHGFLSQSRTPDMANAYTYAMAYNEALANDGRSAAYSAKDLAAYKSGKYPYLYPNVNWWKEVFRNQGNTDIANLTFRGGGQKLRYYTMMNLQNARGFFKNTNNPDGYSTQDKYSKANLRSNLDIVITPTTQLQVNIMGMLEEFSYPGLTSDNLYTKLYTTPANAFPIKTEDGLWGGNSTWDGMYNPVALAQGRAYSKGHGLGLWADATLKQDLSAITPGLGAGLRIGYDNYASYWENHTRSFAYGSTTASGSWDENGEPIAGSTFTGGEDSELSGSSQLDWQYRSFNFQAYLDYNRRFGKSKVSALAMYKYKYNSNAAVNSTYMYVDWSGYVHYGFDERFFIDLALVASTSNLIDPSDRWHLSPTVGVAWNLAREGFMAGSHAVNLFKIRASAGIINTSYVPYQGYWYDQMGGGSGYPLNDSWGQNNSSWGEATMPSFNATVEKAHKYNVGIDATLFNCLNLTADAWMEQRKDLWVNSTYGNSAILGATSSYANAGRVDSKGYEIGLNWYQDLGAGFRMTLGGTYSFATNEIKEMMEQPRSEEYLKQTGRRVNQIWALQAVGFYTDDNDIATSPYQSFGTVAAGDIKYKDQNGDNIIDENDFVPMGYTTIPEIYYGFNFGLEWKGFGFNVAFQGVDHYTVYTTTTGLYRPMVNGATISNYYYNNRWTPETAATARYPRLSTVESTNNTQTSSVWLQNGAYLKLRNAEVYYNFPRALLSHIGMTRAKLYVRGVDLYCWDHVKEIDIESLSSCIPTNKSINIGLQVGF